MKTGQASGRKSHRIDDHKGAVDSVHASMTRKAMNNIRIYLHFVHAGLQSVGGASWQCFVAASMLHITICVPFDAPCVFLETMKMQ